jgi:hypothetical protein
MATIRSGWPRETSQRKKGYFFRRRLAANAHRFLVDLIRVVERLDFRVRDAKYKRRTTPCTEFAWALQTAKAIGQKCKKSIAAKKVFLCRTLLRGELGTRTVE